MKNNNRTSISFKENFRMNAKLRWRSSPDRLRLSFGKRTKRNSTSVIEAPTDVQKLLEKIGLLETIIREQNQRALEGVESQIQEALERQAKINDEAKEIYEAEIAELRDRIEEVRAKSQILAHL